MAKTIAGKNMLLFFRLRTKHATQDAAKLRFQTEHGISMEKETDSTVTKDGNVVTVSDGESSADITSYAYHEDDDTIAVWRELKEYFDDNELVEMWQVDLDSGQDGKDLDVDYFQGYFTSFELTAPADAPVELSYTYTINGRGVKGQDSLTPEQYDAARSTQYEYETLKATGEAV